MSLPGVSLPRSCSEEFRPSRTCFPSLGEDACNLNNWQYTSCLMSDVICCKYIRHHVWYLTYTIDTSYLIYTSYADSTHHVWCLTSYAANCQRSQQRWTMLSATFTHSPRQQQIIAFWWYKSGARFGYRQQDDVKHNARERRARRKARWEKSRDWHELSTESLAKATKSGLNLSPAFGGTNYYQ